MKRIKKDQLNVIVADSRNDMGAAAARDIADTIRTIQQKKDEINIIFAAAPSQNETLQHLIAEPGIEWQKINAFHMDEYIGLQPNSPARFSVYLKEHIFDLVPFKNVFCIRSDATDMEQEAARYSALLAQYPTDIVVLGVGENGHIAFNDPGVADFCDPLAVKTVKLDEICRNQQVNDGCFDTIDDVPKYALTLTVPTLLRADYMFCSVPAATKAWAVKEMLTTDHIDEHCPAAALRLHKNAFLYCDPDSAALLEL